MPRAPRPFIVLLLLAAASGGNAATESSELESRLEEARDFTRLPDRRVTLPQTTVATYQYDDNDFETSVPFHRSFGGVDVDYESAQRFTLSRSGSLRWAEVCLGNSGSSTKSFDFVVHVRDDSGGLPGFVIDRTQGSIPELPSRLYTCRRVSLSAYQVGAGPIWVSVAGPTEGVDNLALMADDSNDRGQRVFTARRREDGVTLLDWTQFRGSVVYGIRLGVAHSNQEDDGDADGDDQEDEGDDGEPTDQTDSTLHNGQFQLAFLASANNRNIQGRVANWSSGKGVLFWLFDEDNPEALVKVLDGRLTNGFWWMDVAVTSDLLTASSVRHQGTNATWSVQTGPARQFEITDPDIADELIHCAVPVDRSDRQCAVVGLGTTISLRDAWDLQGRIPAKYYTETSQAASAATFALFRARLPRKPVGDGTATRAIPEN